MSIFMVVQAIRTTRNGYRRLQRVKVDKNLHLYEEYEPARLVADVIPAGYVIKKEDFKNYVKCDDLYRMQAEAGNNNGKLTK